MLNIYGTIGYTLLQSSEGNNIIVLADMHDKLPKCNNKTNIAKWLKSKFKTSEILLEEVPRHFKLKELWPDSEHTQELKNLYLENTKVIDPVDIRPSLVPFSWEVLTDVKKMPSFEFQLYNIQLSKYLDSINSFFCLNNKKMCETLKIYSPSKLKETKLGSHYLKLKKKYFNYLTKNSKYLNEQLVDIIIMDSDVLEKINNILNSIMEWYICAKIYMKKERPIILHTGLYHSDNVIKWLTRHYNYKVIKNQGINTIEESEQSDNKMKGCINIDMTTDSIF